MSSNASNSYSLDNTHCFPIDLFPDSSICRGPILDFDYGSLQTIQLFVHIVRRPSDFITTVATYHRVRSIYVGILQYAEQQARGVNVALLDYIAKDIGESKEKGMVWIDGCPHFNLSISPDDAHRLITRFPQVPLRWLLHLLCRRDLNYNRPDVESFIWFLFEKTTMTDRLCRIGDPLIEELMRWVLYAFTMSYVDYFHAMAICVHTPDELANMITNLTNMAAARNVQSSQTIMASQLIGWSARYDAAIVQHSNNESMNDFDDDTQFQAIPLSANVSRISSSDLDAIDPFIASSHRKSALSSSLISYPLRPITRPSVPLYSTASAHIPLPRITPSHKAIALTVSAGPDDAKLAGAKHVCSVHVDRLLKILRCLSQDKDVDKPGLRIADEEHIPHPLLGTVLFYQQCEKMYADKFYPQIPHRHIPIRGDGNCGVRATDFAAQWQRLMRYSRDWITGLAEDKAHQAEELKAANDLRTR